MNLMLEAIENILNVASRVSREQIASKTLPIYVRGVMNGEQSIWDEYGVEACRKPKQCF